MKDDVIVKGVVLKKYTYTNKKTGELINCLSVYNYEQDILNKVPVSDMIFKTYEENDTAEIRCYKLSGIDKSGKNYSFYSFK